MFAANFNRVDAMKALHREGRGRQRRDQGRRSRRSDQPRRGVLPAATAATATAAEGAAHRRKDQRRAGRQPAGVQVVLQPPRLAKRPQPRRRRARPAVVSWRTGRRAGGSWRARWWSGWRSRRDGQGANRGPDIAGVTRQYRFNELVSTQGGLTPLLFAARQGHIDAVKALLDAGADVNQVSTGDRTSPLLMAIINGHFDLARFLDRTRRRREACERQRRDAALRRAERPVGAEGALSAAARVHAAEDDAPRADEAADRQGRRRQRAPQDEGVVLGLQLRSRRRRRDWRDAVLARGLCQRRRRDEAAGRPRRRLQDAVGASGGTSAHRRRWPRDGAGRLRPAAGSGRRPRRDAAAGCLRRRIRRGLCRQLASLCARAACWPR